ncbi:MAG: hypothetical protein BWK78_04185 [Thiotrichaceae bacterium IS1]|nr:MAG: hypothetical protein BWK78_04185 [Thiotrichaceae bacterium IS1]
MSHGPSLLEQEIRSDIDERRELMSRIESLCPRYAFSKDDEKLFLGYSIPIVYAIWEGFIQTAFQTYIRELNKLGLTVDTVCKPILVYHIEAKFKQFKQYPEKFKQKASFFDQLNQLYTSKTVDINPVVNTESNVGFKVLNRILEEFNLEVIPDYLEPAYSLSTELKRLLDIRNNVAHGQNSIVVNRTDLERAIKLVEKLMELVFERIISGFMNESYLN